MAAPFAGAPSKLVASLKKQVIQVAARKLRAPLLVLALALICAPAATSGQEQQLRQQAHYFNVNPSSHFRYHEGRQATGGARARSLQPAAEGVAAEPPEVGYSHIYKRSSALLASQGLHRHGQLVGLAPAQNPLRRRMMSEVAAQSRWTSPQMVVEQPRLEHQQHQHQQQQQQQQPQPQPQQQQQQQAADESALAATEPEAASRKQLEEAELLVRQKQHIQYHDQWPSLAGKCHKRTLNFCASVLPFNTTTFPNIIGDTNRFEVKRSLPFFGFLAKSSCNKRLDELLCLLLEPPCSSSSGLALPPCKKFCRLALEGCNEYIPATLAMSSVFDCRQYPDSNEPSVCVNLAQGSKCQADEFKCPDKTCIPRNWLCDGVRDCIFAADEANCTATAGLQSSVCSTEEFKCDGKCVPKAWKCDGERDCLDGSDEEACDQRPRCGPDRFRCADGNGCMPKRWVCDGKAECRDGSDEMNCAQNECSESDFKCDNGICIPKLWRCDRQFDCKDASDERNCTYAPVPEPITPTAPATEQPTAPSTMTTTVAPASDAAAKQQLESSLNEDVSRIIRQEVGEPSSATPSADAKTLKKFDYEMIQSAPNLIQLNDLSGGGGGGDPASSVQLQRTQMQSQSHPAQMQHSLPSTQIDLASVQEVAAPQVAQRARLSKAPAEALANERVPIYRSLFKSLKGVPLAGPGHGARYAVVASRRRRDRLSPSSSRDAAGSSQPASSAANQTAASSKTGSQQHGVASYLQLINSRYNLRLARPQSQPQQQ